MLEKIKRNKKKILILLIIIILIILLSTIVTRTNIIKGIQNLLGAGETTDAYKNPYIPDGFKHIEGEWNTGYVVQETITGNEFVWIPVDGTNIKLQRRNFSVTNVTKDECGEALDEIFSESVKKYGGYYVGRYESGIPKDSDFETDENMDSTGKPVTKKGERIWNNINFLNAQTSAEQMYVNKSEIASSIMNSYAYDTMLDWLSKSGYDVEITSKEWGNYSNNSQSKQRVEVAGSNQSWKANNIYDLAGNVSEWTSEKKGSSYIYRGGSYYNEGNITPAGMREEGNELKVSNATGFRVIMYKTGEKAIENFDKPYIPQGFEHTEGEWNTGFVIKETLTGNEFVWVPVDGYNLELERSDFENTFATMKRATDTLNNKFKASVYENGGYYVGRYEAGVGETNGNNVGVPVSKKGATTWTNISREVAKQSAEKMYEDHSELNSILMNSYAYDTMLKWLKKENYSKNIYNVDTDSSTWGNYRNAGNTKALTGSNEAWKANNIYDIAGNVWEWTTENYLQEGVVRGGDYLSNGDVLPAGAREHAVKESAFDYTGYRTIIYKDNFKGRKFTQISAGSSYSMAVDNEGNIWTWGSNTSGMLGNGTYTKTSIPAKISINENKRINKISGETIHSMAVDNEGNIWTWGQNLNGLLGNGTSINTNTPIKIDINKKISKISAGNNHNIAIDDEGNLWAWGNNYYGQLGNGTAKDSKIPIQINVEGIKFKEISAGKTHSKAIDEEGNLWQWGRTNLAYINTTTSADPIKEPTKINVEGEVKFKEISAGEYHVIAIDEEGNLWSWGNGDNGRIGQGNRGIKYSIPTKINVEGEVKFKKISAGYVHSIAIDEEGNLWSWGDGGLLGDGTTNRSWVPIKINVEEGVRFKEISAGSTHSIAIDEQGKLWTWGKNGSGQLGNGTEADSLVPIQINSILGE